MGNERADELAKKGADTPIYWTRARTWPTVQGGQASNRGLDGEETHRVLEVGKDRKHSKALMEGPQQGRATKLLSMSRQQLSVVVCLLTGHLGLYGHLHRIGKYINP